MEWFTSAPAWLADKADGFTVATWWAVVGTAVIVGAVTALIIATVQRKMTAIKTGALPGPKVTLVHGDITKQHVDIIVNAAKPSLLGGGGVDGAIHRAGGSSILAACQQLRDTTLPAGLNTGDAVETTAGDLPALYVIHTVGPRYRYGFDRSGLLRSCYTESMRRAVELGARTIAFPLISSGVYGWPTQDAIVQFLRAMREAPKNLSEVRLVLFDEGTHELARALMDEED